MFRFVDPQELRERGIDFCQKKDVRGCRFSSSTTRALTSSASTPIGSAKPLIPSASTLIASAKALIPSASALIASAKALMSSTSTLNRFGQGAHLVDIDAYTLGFDGDLVELVRTGGHRGARGQKRHGYINGL